MTFKVGDTAPDFTLPSTDKDVFNLYKELETGPVLLNFYVGDFGINCATYMMKFIESYDSITSLGVRLVPINSDSLDSHRNWKERMGSPFEYLYDKDKTVSKEFGAIVGPGHMVSGFTNREFYLIGTDRKIRYIWKADVPKTLPVFDDVLNGIKSGLALEL
ncbi:MAG: peroxiredoxin family protein [Candidatus Methanomethylophilaceae archaeon]